MYYAMDDSIARKVEQDRLDKIYYDSHNMVQKLAVQQGRCHICTLRPPCRHMDVPTPVQEQQEEDAQEMDPKAMTEDDKANNQNGGYQAEELK